MESGCKVTYVSYMRTTPAKLWHAITDGDMTAQYFWGSPVESSWQIGGRYAYLAPDRSAAMAEGTVLDVQPERRLVLEGRLLYEPAVAADQPYRETWEIEAMGDCCKLTLQAEFAGETATYHAAVGGYPLIVSGLKSLLETGAALNFPG